MISKENILDFETRKKIYEFIEENPGLNVNEISRRTETPRTTLLHHLRFLEKHELVKIKTNGKMKNKGVYKRVYATHELGEQDKEIHELLRTKIPCKIILHFFFSIACSQIELSRELDLHPALVSYHLKKMMKMGIIEEAPMENGIIYTHPTPKYPRIIDRKPQGREIFYRRKNQKTFMAIGRIMIAHKDSLADRQYIDEIFSYYRTLIDIGINKKNRLKNAEKKVIEKDGKKVAYFKLLSEEDLYNVFFEIFKPPFCA